VTDKLSNDIKRKAKIMRSKGEILRAHYSRLLSKIATWAGLTALVATMFVAAPASAYSQIGTRSLTLGSSAPSAVTTYTFQFTTPSTESGLTKAISFQICTSPLQGSCTGVSGATFVGASFNTGAPTTAPFTSTWALGAGGNCGAPSATFACITNATGSTLSTSTSYTVQFTSVTNPNITGQFYAQVSTFTAANGSGAVNDFGGYAVDTAQTMSVTANVQEALTFCVGATSNASCASIGAATVPMITSGSATNPMSTAATSFGNAYMDVFTNGSGGYVVSYFGTTLTSAAGTITSAAGGGSAVNSGGTEQFGFNIVANNPFGSIASATGAAPTNTPTSTTAGYGTANTMAYTAGAMTQIFTMTGANSLVNNLVTITYGANIAPTTKAGAYTATQQYLATATF
jgi:hypothetical protein